MQRRDRCARAALALVFWLGAAGCPEEESNRGPAPLVAPDAQAGARQALRAALAGLGGSGPDADRAVEALEALPAELLGGPRAGEVAAALERAVAEGRLPWARAEALAGRLGVAGLPLLAQGLQVAAPGARRRVAAGLAAAGGEGLRLLLAGTEAAGDERLAPAREALGRLAASGAVRERLQAIELYPALLGGPAGEEALAALVARLADPAPEVRVAAVEAVCALGPRAAPHAAAAAALLRDPDGGVRQVAADALPRLGPPVVPPVSALLAEEDEGLRALAVAVLGRAGEPGLEALLAHRDPSPRVRSAVLWALAAAPGPRALPALEAGLGDEEPRVRQETLRALAGREADAGTVALLSRALGEREPLLVRAALESLERLGARAAGAAPALVRLARGGPPEVRLEALAVLIRVSAEPRALVAQLGELLDAPTPAVRRAALEQLAAVGPGAVGQHRARIARLALKDPDLAVRQAAGAALEALGGAAQEPGAGFG